MKRRFEKQRLQIAKAGIAGSWRDVGRPMTLDAEKRQLAVDLDTENKMPVDKLCEMLGISKPTLYSYVRTARTTDN